MPVNSFDNYPLTWAPTLERGDAPLYTALSAQLEKDIASGLLRPGTKLPPQRELADYLDINLSTVTRAFKICANKGLLRGVNGSGTYVVYDVETKLHERPSSALNLIDLGTMLPETVVQTDVTQLLQQMLAEPGADAMFQYVDANSPWHKAAAVELLRKAQCPAREENVLFASGGQNALAAIFAGVFKPGDKLGTGALVYQGVKSAAKLFGVRLVALSEENGEFTRAGIEYAVKNDNIKGIFAMPDSHNPTTHTMSLAGRQTLATAAQDFGLLVVEDGINTLLSPEGLPTIAALAPEQTIYIASLSKTLVPALRLAYVATPEKYFAALENALYNMNVSQSALLLELASRFVASHRFDALLAARQEGIVQRNIIAEEMLAGYTLWGTRGSLHRWLLLPVGVSGETFEQLALEKGVFVYGAQRFAVGENPPLGGVRLSICTPETTQDLKAGLSIIKEILDSL